jgi:BirA family biotin operon repressor/biotin-[acetyl-CoA-carboxylase] ligase
LLKTAPRFDIGSVRRRLPGRRVDWFERAGSTMLEARNPCAPGRIVVADEQTAGMGRHGRRWHSPPGAGLYVSMVLAADPLPVMMLALGLATREAIALTSPLQADLRWPNDVLLLERKCAGVLAQLEDGAVIAGIGINVSQTQFPAGLDTPATSLLLEGAQVSREDLLLALVDAVDRYCVLPAPEILQRFTEASSYAEGRRIRATVDGRRVEGVTCGLDPSGFLLVREDNGMKTTILAGGVRSCS